MARKKDANKASQICFKCSDELKSSIEDLARLSRRDVSTILVELCTEYVKANRTRITNFRRQAGQPLKMPTFAIPTSKRSVTADDVCDETAAQINFDDLSDEGGESS